MGKKILKWSIGVLLALLLLVAVVAGGVVWLVNTPSGLDMAVGRLHGAIPGSLEIGKIEGGLLGRLELHDVSYTQDAFGIRVKHLILQWVPDELLEHRFHLVALEVEGVTYTEFKPAPKKAKEEAKTPLILPDVTLPLEIVIDNLQVNGVKYNQFGAEKPLVIDRVGLAAMFDAGGLELKRLALAMPGVTASLSGKLDPKRDYPLDFKTDWSFMVEGDKPLSLNGTGTVSGNLKAVEVVQDVSGDVSVALKAHARDVLEDLGWDADITLNRVSNTLLKGAGVPDIERLTLGLRVNASGDTKKAHAQVHLRAEDSMTCNSTSTVDAASASNGANETAPVAPGVTPAAMELATVADVSFSPLEFSVSGNWHAVQWPLAGAPQYVSPDGNFSVSGSLDSFDFTLSTGVRGPSIPEVGLFASGSGSAQDAVIERLHLDLLEGSVDADAKVAWNPAVSWDARVNASGINPQSLADDWQGSVKLVLSSQGELKDGMPDLSVIIHQLGGTLRDRPLSGNGTVEVAGREVNIPALTLGWGSAWVKARGTAGEHLSLAVDASLPDAAEVLPDATGSVALKARLSGSREKPSADGNLEVKGFRFAENSCRNLDAKFSLSLDEDKRSDLVLEARDIAASGQEIPRVSVSFKGLLSDHSFDITAVHEAATLHVAAEHGSYDKKEKSWHGLLAALGIDAGEYGNWQLRKPVSVAASPQDAKFSDLCLEDAGSSLCASLDWMKQGTGNASLRLRQISLERVAHLLPPSITELTGVISADASATLGKVPVGKVEVSLTPGVVTYLVDQGRQVRVRHQGATLNASATDTKVEADLKLVMGKNGVSGRVELPRAPLEADPKTAPLDGELRLSVRQLGLITAFVPAIEETEGTIEADFRLGGMVSDPLIVGKAVFDAAGPDVSMIGLDIDRTRFEILADSQRGLDINGVLKSGKDAINIVGHAALDAEQGWPAHVEIKGSNFRVVDIPDAMVRISPDFEVDYSGKSGVKVTGEITVPEAEITPRQVPAGVKQPSGDVVIVSKENPQGDKPPLPVDVEMGLNLLDNVHFKGFGLDCFITGKLTVEVLPGKEPVGHGELRIKKGTFRFYGHDLTIQKGIISYAGGHLDNPGINLLAVRDVKGTLVGVRVTGYVQDLDVRGYSSDPTVSSQDAITMLITGKSKNDPGFSEAAANTAKVAGADMLAQQLKGYTGLDHLDVSGSGENSEDTRVFAGKDVTDDLTVGVEVGTGDEGTQFVAMYHLWKNLDLEMRSGSSSSGASLLYTIEFR